MAGYRGDIDHANFPPVGMRNPSLVEQQLGSPEKDMPIVEFAASLEVIGAVRAATFIKDIAARALHNT
jgi:hypothetical protein